MKVLDEARVAELWQAIKEHTDQTGGGGSSGPVKWEDIYDRPDLSNVSQQNVYPIMLFSDKWDENEQTVEISAVKGDYSQQKIAPAPDKDSSDLYFKSNVVCIRQDEGSLTFHADTIPTEHLLVYVFITSTVEVKFLTHDRFFWWSPVMTDNSKPVPYEAYASNGTPYRAFEGDYADYSWSNSSAAFKNPWITFNFGRPTYVAGIRIRSDGSSLTPYKYSFEASNDNENWVKIYEEDGANFPLKPNENWKTCFFGPKLYQYYRFTLIESYYGDDYNARIKEMEFFKLVEFSKPFSWWSPEMTANTDYVKDSMEATSYPVSTDAYKVFDGNARNSFYINYGSDEARFIQFYSLHGMAISGIRLTPASGYLSVFPKQFVLEGSYDGETFSTIYESTGEEYEEPASINDVREYKFESCYYRFFRLTCISNYSGRNDIALAEMEFYKMED